MRSSARSISGTLIVCLLAVPSVEAQPSADRIGGPLRGADISAYRFPRSAGLASGTVYAFARDARARAWVGTEDGPFSSEGGQWRAEEVPPGATIAQVRAILFDSVGHRWYAMRNGAYRFADGKWTHYGRAEGVPGAVVYSIIETRAIDGTRRIVLGASDGICVVEADRCRSVALPAGIGSDAFMVRSAESATGMSELWTISASGGAARLRGGEWTTFTAADGLTTTAAEDVVFAPMDAGVRVLIVGSAGVFELERGVGNRERFVLMPGSPRSVYRAAYVPRAGWPDEFWVGTGDGFLLRRRGSQWDTLRLDGDRVRGQVTLMFPDRHDNDTRDVYLGSRGDLLTRLTFASAVRVNLPGRASREWVTNVLQLPGPAFAGQLIVATGSAGMTLVDTLGNTRLLNDPSDPLLVATSVSHWNSTPLNGADRGRASVLSQLIVVGHRGPVWFPRGRAALMPLDSGVTIRKMREIEVPGGKRELVGASTAGFLRWTGSRWVSITSLPTVDATDVFQTRSRDSVTMFATARGGVYTITAGGAQFDTVPHSKLPVAPWLYWTCEVSSADGPIVFVAGERGTVAWRLVESRGAWSTLPLPLRRTINTTKQAVVTCGTDGHVFVGSASGVSIIHVKTQDPSSWEIVGMIGRNDGLPSSEVTAIGKPFNRRIWVGTEYGSAVVELERAMLRPLLPLSVRLSEYPSGREVIDGAVLRYTSDQLRVDAWIDSQTRENESLYDIEWHRESAWWNREGKEGSDSGWTTNATRYITGVNPGRYLLRVQARDFVGRETPVLEWRIQVLSPWWQSWAAWAVYITLVLATLWTLYRWRVGVIQRGTEGLIESERQLQISEQKFRALFDRAADSHVLVESGHIVSANLVAATLFGVKTPEDLIGQKPNDLLPTWGDVRPSAIGRDVLVNRAEETIPVQVTATSIDVGNRVLQHLVIKDMTDVRMAERSRAQLESHLQERQRLEALGTLAGGIAHDFNNLLGVIRGNAELATGSVSDAALTNEHLASIVDASDRARDLVRQILAFSQSPLPKQELVDLSMVLRSLQPLLRRMIPSSIRFELDGVDTPHFIEGDSAPLQQVLLNLASNAEYAMRKQGSGVLIMSLRDDVSPASSPPPAGRVVRLTVRDTGEGMLPAVIARVFEPFYTTKPTGEGTGLGLSVLHGVVQSHGGRVSVTSAVHVGTTVEVVFPAAESSAVMTRNRVGSGAQALPATTTEPPETATVATTSTAPRVTRSVSPDLPFRRYHGAKLIVVDDEPQVGRVIELALSRFGYSVRVYQRSEDALQILQSDIDGVDLLLTDQTMPGMTGDVLAETVHQLDPRLPVLILTGFSHKLTAERLAEVGAIAVLQKPIDLESLDAAVDAALRTSVESGCRSWS